MHIQKHCVWVKCFSDVKDNEPHRGKTKANPKINILMSENIRQRRLNIFSLESFDALYHHHVEPYYHFQSYYYHVIIKHETSEFPREKILAGMRLIIFRLAFLLYVLLSCA